jgi:hypothetical protein
MKTLIFLLFLGTSGIAAAPRRQPPDLQRLALAADIIVVAEVKTVGKAPGFWSGFIVARQSVKYKTLTVLKGQLKATELDVWFVIDADNPFVEPLEPQVSTMLFQPGNRHVVFLRRNSGAPGDEPGFTADRRFESVAPENHLWSLTADESTLNQLQQMISAQRSDGK